MFRSMTAYGRASILASFGRIQVELHSVNRKYLEVVNFLPKEFVRFDGDIRNWISEKIFRGQVTVRVNVTYAEAMPISVIPNVAYAKQLRNACSLLAEEMHIQNRELLFIEILKNHEDILTFEEHLTNTEEIKGYLRQVIESVISEALEMKIREGRALQRDVSQRIDQLHAYIVSIESHAREVVDYYREKLRQRLQELFSENAELEERLLREIALLAERVDISEEITRFKSHLMQIADIMKINDQPVGKKCEFLLQELMRETNTIASKSQNLSISHLTVETKSELERIREQIQNIE